MYALYGEKTTIDGKEALLIERIVNIDYSEPEGNPILVEDLPNVPDNKNGIRYVPYWNVTDTCYAFLEEPVPLSAEERIAQLEAEKAAMRQELDDLTILILQQGGALIG